MTPDREDPHAAGPVTNWLKALSKSPRSYVEDYQDEGGVYIWRCVTCSRFFAGHKGRFICKLCNQTKPKKMKLNFYNPLHVAPFALVFLIVSVGDLLVRVPQVVKDPEQDPDYLLGAMSPIGQAAASLFVAASAWLFIIAIIKPNRKDL